MEISSHTNTAAENAAVFRNVLKNVPSWETFIKTLDTVFNTPLDDQQHDDYCDIKNSKECNCVLSRLVLNKGKATDILIHDKMHFICWGIADGLGGGPMFNYVKELADLFFRESTLSWGAKSLINLAGNENNLSIHKDDHYVISWQCQGSVEYRIYEHTDHDFVVPIDPEGLSYISYLLNPGDIIYIPKGVPHQAIAFEPRATIVIQSNLKIDFIHGDLI